MKKHLYRFAVTVSAIFVAAVTIFTNFAFADAADTTNKILNKAYATQLRYCYTDNKVFNKSVVIATNSLTNTVTDLKGGLVNLVLSDTNRVPSNSSGSIGSKNIRHLPTSLAPNDAITCATLLDNSLSRSGTVKIPKATSPLAEQEKFLTALGYKCASSTNNSAEVVGGCDKEPDGSTLTRTYTYDSEAAAADTAIKNIFGFASAADTALTDKQVVILYQGFLQGVYGAELKCGKDETSGLKASDGWYDVKIADKSNGNNMRECKAKAASGKEDIEVYGLDGTNSNYFAKDQKSTFKDVCAVLSNTSVKSLSDEQIAAVESISGSAASYDAATGLNSGAGSGAGTANSDDKDAADPCNDNSAALGWLICPTMKGAAEALATAYDNWIEPRLQVDSGILASMDAQNSEHGVYIAWSTFRDFANIVFVIMMLVVIFSQLTGVGIDNYGIKRLLPRLIVTAVLVNFSFLICQFAISISDIVGASLNDFLQGIGNNITLNVNQEGNPAGPSQLIQYIVAGLVGTGVAGAAVIAVYKVSGLSFILPAFLTIMSAFAGLFFGFVLLGARQAIIVILVVIAPLAMVLNMLPNTSSLFNKWRSIFVNLLMVYPAAGLLIGGGYLASRIILSIDTQSFIIQLLGLIIMIVPYFAIIPLVRTSVNAFANAGNMISNFGNNLRNGTGRFVRSSEAYKNLQTRAASVGAKGFGSPTSSNPFSRGINRLTRRRGVLAARQMKANENREKEEKEARIYQDELTTGPQSDTALESDIASALQSGNQNEFEVKMARYSRQNSKGAADFLSKYLSGSWRDADGNTVGIDMNNRASQNQMSMIRKQFADDRDLQGQLKRRDKTVFEMVNDIGSFHNVDYARYGQNQTIEDRMNQSTFAIGRDMAQGKMTADTTNSMLNSTDDRVVSGILSDSGKRDVLQAFSQHSASGAAASAFNPGDNAAIRALAGQYQSNIDTTESTAAATAQQARDEEDAARRGRQSLSISNENGAVFNVRHDNAQVSGYAAPQDFNANGSFQAANGDTILMSQGADGKTNAYWNATTGRHVNATTGAELLRTGSNFQDSNVKTPSGFNTTGSFNSKSGDTIYVGRRDDGSDVYWNASQNRVIAPDQGAQLRSEGTNARTWRNNPPSGPANA